MCYDVETQLRRQLKTAIHKGAAIEEIEYLKIKLDQFIQAYGEEELDANEHYWSMGFQHQKIPVITDEHPDELQFFHWGLIPSWSKNPEQAKIMAGKCLNTRSETMFEKPAFRSAAKDRRCVIALSGYYEHYWADKNGKNKIPYYVRHKDGKPLYMAGLWEEWLNKETGEVVKTCSIITTNANIKLSEVHNRNPLDPRMLVILDLEDIPNWLAPIECKEDIELLQSICSPYYDEALEVYPVRQLRGKNGIGDVPQASEPFEYHIIGMP